MSSPTVSAGDLFIGSRDRRDEAGSPKTTAADNDERGSLYCLDAVTGRLKWRFREWAGSGIGWVDSSAAIVGDRIYFSARDGHFYCIDRQGRPVWRADTAGRNDASSPVVEDGRVYFSSGTEFFSLRADDGSLVWRTPSGRAGRPGQYAYSSPALVGGTIYTAANDAVFYALDAGTGAVKWRYETSGGNPFLFSPAVAEGRLLAATGEFNPYACAVDLATGIAAWSFKAPGASFFLSSPAISNGTAYLGMGAPDQTLFALDLATGVEKWRRTLGYSNTFGFTSSPAVVGSLVIVGASQAKSSSPSLGRLLILDSETGALRYLDTLPKPIASSPAVANGRVYVAATNGVVYAYAGPPGSSATDGTRPRQGLPPLRGSGIVNPKPKTRGG